MPVELEASFSNEAEKVHNHPGEKWLGHTIVCIYRHRSGNHGVTEAHDGSQQGESLHFIYPKV